MWCCGVCVAPRKCSLLFCMLGMHGNVTSFGWQLNCVIPYAAILHLPANGKGTLYHLSNCYTPFTFTLQASLSAVTAASAALCVVSCHLCIQVPLHFAHICGNTCFSQ